MNHCIQWWSLSVPPVPLQQLLLLAETLKSRLLSQPLSSHTCHSLAEVFPGCNCFYLRVDKNYPALGVHEAGAGKGFFCVCSWKKFFHHHLKPRKMGTFPFSVQWLEFPYCKNSWVFYLEYSDVFLPWEVFSIELGDVDEVAFEIPI